MHDLADGHFTSEILTQQADGTNKVFKTGNRNLLTNGGEGAPTDPQIFVNGILAALHDLDQNAGLITLNSAPALLANVEARYYFWMATGAEMQFFYDTARGFIGVFGDEQDEDPITWNPLYVPAVVQYTAAQASRSLASLTHWYYSANAGNKSMNKDQVSRKFMEQAKEFEVQAEKLRMAVSTRFDQNKAPAASSVLGLRGTRYWEPRR